MTGCSINNDVQHLKLKEDLLITSNNKNQLIEFYKDNLSNNSGYKVKLVDLYLDVEDINSAEFYINSYSQRDLTKPEFIFTIAKVNYKKELFASAEIELEKYRKHGGHLKEYYLLKARVLTGLKRFDEAIEHFEKSRAYGVLDKDVNNNIAVVYMLKADYLSARDILENLYNRYPADERVKSNLLITLVNLNKYESALFVLKKEHNDKRAKELLALLINNVSTKIDRKIDLSDIDRCIVISMNSEKNHYSKYNANKVSVVNAENVRGKIKSENSQNVKKTLKYRVQVLATNKKIESGFLSRLRKKYGEVYLNHIGGLDKYSVGDFYNRTDVDNFFKTVDIPGAFVVKDYQ